MTLRGIVFGFVLAGMIGGILAGAIDALGAMGGVQPGLVLAGSMGFHVIFGAVAGLLAGLLFPFLPAGLTASRLLQRLAARLRPGSAVGLHDRCRTVAAVWLLLVIGGPGLALLTRGYRLVISRVQSPELAAVATAGLALLGLAGAAAISAPLHAGLARALEFVVRRRPQLTPLVHPTAHLVAVVIAAGAVAASLLGDERETMRALDLRPVISAVLVMGPTLLLGEMLSGPLSSVKPRRALMALGFLAFFAAAAAAAGLRAPAARSEIVERTGSGRLLVAALRAPFDADGDGFARVLGGGDCDDDDPAVNPAAVDVPANGVDEDCSGADAVPPPPAPPPPPPPTEPAGLGLAPPYNVVLVTIDSLRADHVGALGYERPTTPALDELALDSVVFEVAYSASAKTPTAIPAMLTGRYPSELWRDDAHFTTYSPRNVFLAETLGAAGYRTAGFPSHWYFDPRYGLGQGFAVWQPYMTERGRMEKQPTAETVVVAAVESLQNSPPDPERPFFVWLHLLDPHKDYIEHLDIPRFGGDPIDRYDHEIRYVDTWLAYLFDTLSRRADYHRTVVVVTSDHGEAFGEHGYRYHGFGLHEHQLRVPLIVRVPGLEPRRVLDPVGLIDLAPTLLDLAGVRPEEPERARMGLRGRTLLPLLGGFERPAQPIFAEMPRGPHNAEQFALRVGRLKLMYSATGDRWQLFDLVDDPLEKTDLAPGEPERLAEMRAALTRLRAGLDRRAPIPGTPPAPGAPLAPPPAAP